MNEITIKSNTEEVFNQLKSYTLKEVTKVEKSALRKVANILKNQTKRNLRKALPASKTGNRKYQDKLIDGVRSVVYKKGGTAKVHVLGSRKKGSGTFRLKFFETGTVVRQTNKKKNRGRIKGLYFFKDAIAQSKQKQVQAIDATITKTIEKINNKKFNARLK